MGRWYEDVGSSISDAVGSVSGAIGDAAGAVASFPGDAWAELSGANDTRRARDQQLAGIGQAQGAVTDAYGQAQGYLQPYNNPQDYQRLRDMVFNEKFTPSPMAFLPQQYQQTQAPVQQQYQQTQRPNFGQYAAPQAPGSQQFQGQQFNQSYQEPAFNFQADPGYQFRRDEALRAVNQGNAARGLRNSTANQNQLMNTAAGLAGQAYNDAFNQFNTNRNFGRGAFESDRAANMALNNQNFNQFANQRDYGYNAYQDQRNFGRDVFSQDRAFNQADYLSARDFGRDIFNQDRAFNQAAYQDQRNFGRDVYNQDRAFGYGSAMDAYNQNNQRLQDQYLRLNQLANMGYNAAGQMSQNATNYGNAQAGLYGNAADARAAATLGASAANRQMLGDAVDFGFSVYDRAAGASGVKR